MPDLSLREWALLAPIAAGVLWMGVYPESFMAPMRKDVTTLLARVERAAPRGRRAARDGRAAAGAAGEPAHDGGGRTD